MKAADRKLDHILKVMRVGLQVENEIQKHYVTDTLLKLDVEDDDYLTFSDLLNI